MQTRHTSEGFTLVELMVVVLIIGIIVSIAIPVFVATSRTAALKTCQTNQRTIEGAVQQWLAGDPTNVWTAQVIDGNDNLSDAATQFLAEAPHCPNATAAFYGANDEGSVTADDLVSGDPVPATWISSTGHDHY